MSNTAEKLLQNLLAKWTGIDLSLSVFLSKGVGRESVFRWRDESTGEMEEG